MTLETDGVRVKRNPKQVPDFEVGEDGVLKRFEDPVKNRNALHQRVREDWIALEYVHIVRRRLARCYREQGVNHYENCHDLAKQYYELVKAPNHGALYTKK